MVNLTIRLSKDAGMGAASSKLATVVDLEPLISSGPPACLDHLELDEMPQAAGVGALTVNATVNILGRKCQRKLGSKVHFCVRCNFPIAIYGRLDPCEHVFCLICAKKDPICYLCEERIICIQKLEVLEGIYICGAPGCLRSFLKKPELETHIEDTHKALLHKLGERDEKAETHLQTQSHPVTPTIQGQSLPLSPPLPPQPQQPRQQQPQSSEDKPVRGHVKQSPSVSSNFQREEKQLRSHQPKTGNHQQDRHAQKQQQHPQHQHAHISQKKSQQNFHDNHQQHDHPQQHAHHQVQQHQGQQEKQHHPSHQEKQQQHPEMQHPERPLHRPPHQQGILPPFPAQSFPSSYHTQSDKNHFQQPHTPRYDSPKFATFIDHRMPLHPGIPDYEEKSRPRHSGNAGTEREGGPLSNGQQEGFVSIERQPPMQHYHSEYGPRGPQIMGKGMDHPPHFQEMLHAHLSPAPKRGKYGPSPPIGEGSADNTLTSAWAGGISKFGPGPGPGFVG